MDEHIHEILDDLEDEIAAGKDPSRAVDDLMEEAINRFRNTLQQAMNERVYYCQYESAEAQELEEDTP